jgi:hypothetical protein
VVQGVLPGDDNGEEDPIPHRDVYALDPHRPHLRHQSKCHIIAPSISPGQIHTNRYFPGPEKATKSVSLLLPLGVVLGCSTVNLSKAMERSFFGNEQCQYISYLTLSYHGPYCFTVSNALPGYHMLYF